MPTKDEIRALTRDIGSDGLIELIEEDLLDNKIDDARKVLLGALDRLLKDGDIDEQTAAGFYRRLGFSPSEAAQIRQNAQSEF